MPNAKGSAPTAIVAITVFVAASIAENVLSAELAT
jgi:hypothetical protein